MENIKNHFGNIVLFIYIVILYYVLAIKIENTENVLNPKLNYSNEKLVQENKNTSRKFSFLKL